MFILNRIEEYSKHWSNLNFTEKDDFLKELANFSNNNPEEFYRFIHQIDMDDCETFEIVFQAATKYSNQHFEFIKEDIERLTKHLLKEVLDEDDYYFSLSEIDLKYFLETNAILFHEVIKYLISTISKANPTAVNEAIIDFLESCIWELDKIQDTTEIAGYKRKLYQIESLKKSERTAIKHIFNEEEIDSPAIKYSKIAIGILLLLVAIWSYNDLRVSVNWNTINMKHCTYLSLGIAFVISNIFFKIFNFIKGCLFRFVFSMLIFSCIGLKSVFYVFDLGYMKFIEDWLFSA
ncbi:MAG: hypothetical protein ACK5MZ_06015 [Aestuariibaculum sp.]